MKRAGIKVIVPVMSLMFLTACADEKKESDGKTEK